jgi:hypothetical protein
VKSHGDGAQRTACDLMIIDEAHRAKGDGSAFNDALRSLGHHAKRTLILTATPFSIRLSELEQLLRFAGASRLDAVRRYANELKRVYTLGDGHDADVEARRLVGVAKAAIEALRPYLIRHGIDDLMAPERKHFGSDSAGRWEIATPPASRDDIELLLRTDRLLQLAPERTGERRNDPRFHIGCQHLRAEIARIAERSQARDSDVVRRHVKAATRSLAARRRQAHPKIAAVSDAIRTVLEGDEKVLVFCHHRATASELLSTLERSLRGDVSLVGPSEPVWRDAWRSALPHASVSGDEPLLAPIIDWLCSPGIRSQVGRWLGEPAGHAKALGKQLGRTRPRNASPRVPSILEAARKLAASLLDNQSTSTRALLKNIAKRTRTFGGKGSHFPGRLDAGYRVMGSWDHDGHDPPATLYTGKPDVVLAVFNSPFGPDVLVATDRLSEGVDLHRYCRHLVHYELDPSPIRTLQRNGRVRRVGSWGALTDQPIRHAYPTFGGTRDEKAVGVMRQRIEAFGLLLGGVPSLEQETDDSEQSFAERVLRSARSELQPLNRRLRV